MDHTVSFPSSICNSNIPSKDKTELWINTGEVRPNSSKYRSIPVFETLDGFKSPGFYFENVSGVREVKKIVSIPRVSTYHTDSPSIQNSKALTGSTKKRSKLDTAISVNALQFKHYPDHSFRGSVSEPALDVAKDRGDNINFQDVYRDQNLLANKNKYFGEGKHRTSNDGGIKGCIYVKDSGKVFKSTIEAKNPEAEDGMYYNSSGVKREKYGNMSHSLVNSISKNKLSNRHVTFTTNNMQNSKEWSDDFEIAIFLSGIKNIPEKSPNKRSKSFVNRKEESEYRIKPDRKEKKKNVSKNDKALVLRKHFEMVRENYQSPSKMFEINQYNTNRSYSHEAKQHRKSKIQLKFSSESESEYILEDPDKTPKHFGRLMYATEKESSVRNCTYNENESQNVRTSYRSKKNDATSYRSKVKSLSSASQLGDVCRVTKIKISDEELWEKFEFIFRSFASTTRHSGEVIPRKISTEWMTMSGVVDDIITVKEADDAFRQAAGAKITMNALEYKDFLIMLTLRMKLPYYEIYRRMCGI